MSEFNPSDPNTTDVAETVKDTGVQIYTTDTEGVATNFVHREMVQARKLLLYTQIGSLVVTLIIVSYIGYITYHLNRTLEPKEAAIVATGIIENQVETQGDQLAGQIKERVPVLIGQIPDYALKQIPLYRTALEGQITGYMEKSFASTSDKLSGTFDDLLDANKDNIKQMLADGQNPTATKAVGDAVEKQLTTYLNTTSVNGETLTSKLNMSYATLRDVEKQMTHLSANQNLTPEEKKARRSIGLLMEKIYVTQHTQKSASIAAPTKNMVATR